MKNRIHSRLWLYFATVIFAVILITAIVTVFAVFALYQLGILTNSNGNLLVTFSFLLGISAVIGTAVSIVVGHKILNPITEFSNVAKRVAGSDFDVRVENKSNIKEITELTQNFNMMIQELSSIETLRNDFVVNVSHEFKTPIAAIEGYATLLQNKNLSEQDRDEYIQMIIESSRQLSSLSGNILALSKLENQEILPEKAKFRLDEQIRQAILLLESKWSAKNIDLQVELPNVNYVGNKKLLMQVWMNLIDNAIKFSHDNGTISIVLTEDDEAVTVKVSDTGSGMSDATQRHVFDKFYQGDTSRKAEGNGLGLALCNRIIELCEGRIMVRSKLGKGSSFTVTLPVESYITKKQVLSKSKI